MTASLARNGKGKANPGRCIFWPTFPRRHQRRVLNLVPHAGVHSAPNTSSGPAGSSYIFAPQGHLSLVAAISSPKAGDTGRALNWVERGQPLTHGAVLTGGRVTLPWAPGGRVERVGSATASFLHLFRRPAKNADQHIAKSFCPVAPSVFGSAHGSNHEGTNARKAVNYCQGFGNVCRA